MTLQIDLLAVGVHPDDVELSCSGTFLKHVAQGRRCGILDLTKGELGTRGNASLRLQEAAAAAKILGADFRDNLGLADGFFRNDQESLLRLIEKIRHYRPRIVLANAVRDRHPDHGRAAKLISEACFYSGLRRIETEYEGKLQEAWRPAAVYHYIQDRLLEPNFIVDVSPYVEKKMEAIRAFASQFYDPSSSEPVTPISTPEFLEQVKARMATYGRQIGVAYGEGFTAARAPGVNDLFDLL